MSKEFKAKMDAADTTFQTVRKSARAELIKTMREKLSDLAFYEGIISLNDPSTYLATSRRVELGKLGGDVLPYAHHYYFEKGQIYGEFFTAERTWKYPVAPKEIPFEWENQFCYQDNQLLEIARNIEKALKSAQEEERRIEEKNLARSSARPTHTE
jgi:hypothetical protein